LTDLVGSIFALELFAPSRDLFLISPWLSDVPIIRNGQADVRALVPELAIGDIWLSVLLRRLAIKGTTIRVITRTEGHNATDEFVRQLPDAIEVRRHDPLHAKGLISDHAYVSGSMNFTFSGLHLNDEMVDLKTAPADVGKALLEAQRYWESITP
jgi:phosphatidylserine/phosphatidylglycerophosphate/cardiolipin synthase-like enzyme